MRYIGRGQRRDEQVVCVHERVVCEGTTFCIAGDRSSFIPDVSSPSSSASVYSSSGSSVTAISCIIFSDTTRRHAERQALVPPLPRQKRSVGRQLPTAPSAMRAAVAVYIVHVIRKGTHALSSSSRKRVSTSSAARRCGRCPGERAASLRSALRNRLCSSERRGGRESTYSPTERIAWVRAYSTSKQLQAPHSRER